MSRDDRPHLTKGSEIAGIVGAVVAVLTLVFGLGGRVNKPESGNAAESSTAAPMAILPKSPRRKITARKIDHQNSIGLSSNPTDPDTSYSSPNAARTSPDGTASEPGLSPLQATPPTATPEDRSHRSYPQYDPNPAPQPFDSATTVTVSGHIDTDVGRSNTSVKRQFSPQVFSYISDAGRACRLDNALIFGDFGINDPVVIIRKGSQPVAGNLTDESAQFYRCIGDVRFVIPVDRNGITQMDVVLPRQEQNCKLQSLSPIQVGGLLIKTFCIDHSTNNNRDELAELPERYSVELPLPGQPLSATKGYIKFNHQFALGTCRVMASYDRGSLDKTFTLRQDGSTEFSIANSRTQPVQGDVNFSLTSE